MTACGAGNPDNPDADYRCEYPAGHDRIWRYGAWQDHGSLSEQVWWVIAPYTEDEVGAITFVISRAKVNPEFEQLLLIELAALGWTVKRSTADDDTNEFAALSYGQHAPLLHDPEDRVIDRPEYRAAGYTVIEPRNR